MELDLEGLRIAAAQTGVVVSFPVERSSSWIDIIVTPDYGVPRGEEDQFFSDFKKGIANFNLPWDRIRWHFFYHSPQPKPPC